MYRAVTTLARRVSATCVRHHSTVTVEQGVSNTGNRLRIAEERYCADHSTPLPTTLDQALRALTEDTIREFPNAHMMSSTAAAMFLRQWCFVARPRSVLEIGTFTGVSTLAMASALSPDARLVSLEKDPEPLALASKYIEKMGHASSVTFMQGAAEDSLRQLAEQKQSFDFIFLDADKGGYISYLDHVLNNDMLAEHGSMLVDNVLYWGQVHRLAGGYEDDNVQASKNIRRMARKVHAFNEHVKREPRVQASMLPVFDGFTILTLRK
ncbi:O-methyltransferase-domain-containing protein [Gongronella butleri]|nr:O-methyltransferase-domain-containing protein [Gongronella butleri]